MVLRLTDVSLQDSDPARYETRQPVRDLLQFRKALQDKPMSFAFVDGRVESVCPRSDDEPWAANIKRGIISSLQNTMTSLKGVSNTRETDISGDCPVKYEVTSSSGWSHVLRVKKTKDLLSCSNRHAAESIFQGMPYSTTSDIQSTPLMKSTYSCDQEIDTRTRIMSTSTCTEVHAFRPFAKSDSGAMTQVSYKLTFKQEVEGTQPADRSTKVRSSLLFDHTLSSAQMADTMREAQQTITDICQQISVDVRPETPGLFSNLVRQLKRLDTRTLRQVQQATTSGMCTKAEQLFRDALPLLGTTASVVLMRDLINGQQATDMEVDIWLTSIGFIKNPTRDMMRELKPLLSTKFTQSALPISSVVNTYCRQYDSQQSSAEVQQMVKMFEEELHYNCRSQSDEQTRMLTALRAVGNAGLAASSITDTLDRCAMNNDIPMVVRVAAINAFRRIECTSGNREKMLRLAESKEADSELRINAYLAAMQCVNDLMLPRIQTILESEEINQVGSFIWTHLTNLQETSNPLKTKIREIIENAELKKEFDLDKRKFSRNIEMSTFSELLNIGASVESNLIWSTNSFVPRSAMVNLTVDMFGQSINLLEVGGRVQGIEDLLERLFGPGSKEFDNLLSRDKRALVRDDVLSTIDRKFGKTTDTDQLSYYLRIFGNDVRAGDIFQFDIESIKSRFNFLDWLIELAKERSIDVTRNFRFLDASLAIPTGTGMPVRLMAEGTATISLTARGKVDIRQMFSSPSTFDISGSVKPSAAVEVRGEMGVDAFVAKTGLKMVNILHTSTILDGALQLRDGKIFNLDFNMPQDKMEIFSAETHLYVTYREQNREQKRIPSQMWQWKRCSCPTITEKTGLELCAEISLPNGKEMMMLPMAGPAVARVYLTKQDTYRGVHFDASYVQSQADGTDVVRLSFNTPGSRTDREFTTVFRLDRPQRQVSLDVKTPWKKLNVQGSLVNTDALKQASLKAMLDETIEYSINAEVGISETPRREMRYVPKLEIVMPNRPNIVFDGLVTYAKGQRAEVKLALKNAFNDPVTAEGAVQVRERRGSVKYDVALQISSSIIKGSFSGYTSNTRDELSKSWASRGELIYVYKGGRKERVVVNHKVRDQSTENLKSYSMDGSWMSTVWPRYNGQASVDLSYSPTSLRTKVEAGLDDTRKVTIITSAAYDVTGRDKKINGLFKFMVPYKDWNYELKLDHINNWESLQSNATVSYGTTQQPATASLDIGLKKESTRPLNIIGEARLRYPGREMILTEMLTERAPREYQNVLNVQVQRGTTARVVSTYKMLPRHEFTNDINVPNMDPIRLNGHLNPTLRNMEARLDLGFRGKTYLVDASWQHRGTINAFNTRANAELAYAGYTAGLSTEVSRRDQEFSGNVEAKLNQDKKITISGQVTASLMTPKLMARVEWPQNFVQITGTGKYEHRGWYSTTNDLEGTIKMTSSLRGLEELGMSFIHDQTANSFKTNGEVSWAANQKITGELSMDGGKMTLTLTTPFQGYQTVKVDSTYSRRGLSGAVNTKVQWDRKQMTMQLSGDANQPSRMMFGNMQFSSPFNGFEQLSATLRHTGSGGTYQTNAVVSWARGQQVSVAMNMAHQVTGSVTSNRGDLTVSTPFRTFRTGKVTWNHEHSPDTWKCHHEVEADTRKFVVDIDAAHQLTRATRRVTMKASFQCPQLADWLQNAAINVDYQHDMRAWRSVGKADAQWGRYAFGLEHDINIDPYRAIVIKAKVTTPFPGFEQLGIGLNNQRTSNGWTTNNELVMGSNGKATLDGSLNYNGYSFDGMIRMTTPIRSLERIVANVRNTQQQDGVWATHVDLQYAPEKMIALDGKLGWENRKTLEFEASSPCPYLRQMKFTAGYSGTLRSFQAATELQHNMIGRDKIMASVSANTMNTRNMNGQVTIRTPFTKLSVFKVEARHIRDTEEHMATTASWELNRYKGSLLHDLSARSWVDFDMRQDIEYINNRKIETTASFRLDPKIVVTASFKSPFESARMASFAFNQEGPLDNFKISSEVTYNRVNKIVTNMEFALTDQSLRTFFRLTTPFSAVDRVAVNINLTGRPMQFNLDSSFELNTDKITKTLEFQLDRQTLRVVGRLETPARGLRTITYTVNHSGNWRDFNNNFLLNCDGQEITASSEFKIDGPSGKFELRTPYSALSSVIANFAHMTKPGRSFTGWTNSASLEVNGRRYTGTSEWSGNVNEFTTTVSISTPHRQFSRFTTELTHRGNLRQFSSQLRMTTPFSAVRTLLIVLNHRGDPTDLASDLTITCNDQTISGAVTFKNNRRQTEGALTVQTPYNGYERFRSSFSYAGTPMDFTTTAAVELPFRGYERFSAELKHSGNPMSFQTSGKLETPLQNARTISFRISNSIAEGQITTSGQLVLPAGTLSATVTYNGDPTNFRANLNIQTPFQSFTTFVIGLEHQTTLSGLKSLVTIQTPFSGYENFALSVSKSGDMMNMQLGAELTTPIRRLEKTAISWSHSIDNNVEVRGSLETSVPGYDSFSVVVSHINTRRSTKTNAAIETSVRGFPKFSAASEYSEYRKGFKWSGSVETPIRGYERWTMGIENRPSENDAGFSTVIQATTPVRGYNSFGATMTHTGDVSQFVTTLSVQTPFRAVPTIDISLNHRGIRPSDFATSLSIDYSGKKIETELAFKMGPKSRNEYTYDGNFKLVAPCPYFNDFSITAVHTRRTEMKTGSLDVTLNGAKKVDFDYSYTTSGDRNININVRSPYPLATELSLAGTGQGSAVVNWDTTADDRNVRFDFGLKNVQTSSQTERSVNFKTMVARRTVGFDVGYMMTANKFTSRGELMWDHDAEREFSYEIEAGQTMQRGLVSFDGRVKITSFLFNTDSLFSHKITGSRRHVTEIQLDTTEKLTIRSDLNLGSSSGFSHTLTVQHPRLTRDVTLVTDGTSNGFKSTLTYERHTWTLEGSLTDESRRSGPKYTSMVRLSSPSNLFDVQLSSDLASDYDTITSGLAVKYLTTRDRQMKTFALRTEISRLRKELKIELETPIDTVKLSTQNREMNLETGIVRYDVAAESSRFNVRSTVDFSLADRSLDLKFYNTPESFVQMFGQLASPTQATLEISHTTQRTPTNDAHVSLSFNDNERLLTGRTSVRPELWNDIRNLFRPENFAVSPRLSRDLSQFQSMMAEDMRYKSQYLSQSVVVPLASVASYYQNEMNNKMNQINTVFNTMYRANEFYIRDIHQALKRHYDNCSRQMQYKMAELQRSYAIWSSRIQQKMDEIQDSFQRFQDMTSERVSRWWQTVSASWQPSLDQLKPYFDSAFDTLKSKLMDLVDRIRNDPRLQAWINKLTTMNPSDYFLPPSQWQDRLMSYADRVDQWIQQVTERQDVRYVHNWVLDAIQKNKWFYELLGFEQQMNEWIAQARTLTWEKVKTKIREVANTYLKLDKTRWTTWNPQRGEYAFQVYVPFDLPDMSFFSRYDPRPFLTRFRDWLIRQLPAEDLTLLDTLYMYKPSSDINNWIPPFKSHATLTGPQHYMTFDHRFFEFAGDCSYLLARDFIGGTFSVIVNYDRPTRGQPVKKSLTVITDGRQIEVFPDAKVTVDGTRVEMPIKVANMSVMRNGNMIRVMDDLRGLDVMCDLPHDHCTVAISGWYFGKTAGLLGTYDNEPSNDLMTIDKSLMTEPAQVAETWTVGQRCRSANRAIVVNPDTETRRYRACAELFANASSMFRTGYRVVDPAMFMTMCLNDVSISDNSLEGQTDICRTAAAYVHECRRHEVHLRMPKQCVRCEVPDTGKVFYEMETIKLEQPSDIPRAADIVLVIQHAPCNRDVLGRISGLVDNIDKAMQSEGLTSTRYAVVGFGGKQSHLMNVHTHTMDGQLFNSASKLALAIDRFDLEPGTNVDTLLAVQYAAQLPFRAGASKTVVLLACDSCQETKTRYSDVQRSLLNNDVRLHVLIQDIIRLKSKSPKTAYIYGVDEQTVYTRKDVAGDELTGEPDLRRYIRLPKDLCVAMTHDTDGSVFSVRQWLDSRILTQKQFVDVMVRTMARKAQPTDCQLCQCSTDDAQVGFSQCRSCQPRDPLNLLLQDFTDDGDDDNDDAENSDESGMTSETATRSPNKSKVTRKRPDEQQPTRARPVRPTVRPTRRPSRVTRKPSFFF